MLNPQDIKKDTIILAKSWHPERTMGGSGVAVVMQDADETNFLSIQWIHSVCNEYAPFDVVAISSFHEAFDIIEERQREQYIPKDWKPKKDVISSLLSMMSVSTKHL